MTAVDFVLALLAVVCFLLAAFNVPFRLNWIGLGLALFAMIWVIQYGAALS